jgi:hypothetical protein
MHSYTVLADDRDLASACATDRGEPTKIVLIWATFERTDRAHTGDQNGGSRAPLIEGGHLERELCGTAATTIAAWFVGRVPCSGAARFRRLCALVGKLPLDG